MDNIYFVFKGWNNNALYSASYGIRANEPHTAEHVWQGNERISRQLGRLISGVNTQNAAQSATCWHPALKRLYLVYRNADTDELTIGYYDGRAWHGGSTLLFPGGVGPRKTKHQPAMAMFLHQMQLVYKSAADNTILWTSMGPDGRWQPTQHIKLQNGSPLTTSDDVSLAVYHGELWLLYKDAHDNTLHACIYKGGNYWAVSRIITIPGQNVPAMSCHGPTAAAHDDKLYVCYQDQNSNNLYVATYHHQRGWAGNQPITCHSPGGQTSIPASTMAPGMVSFEGKLQLVYRSQTEARLFNATFDGQQWSGNQPINNLPGAIDPWSDHNPSLSVTPFPVLTPGNWLQHIPPTRTIGEINLLGTHDSAAINTSGRSTPYACHDRTIAQQLRDGVRLLDIRILVERENGEFRFWTCHGKFSAGHAHTNRYERLDDVLNTCREFLRQYPSEFIVMLMQVDDWHDAKSDQDKPIAKTRLKEFLGKYPFHAWSANLPTNKDVKGKFVLFSRLDIPDLKLGFDWSDNTEWKDYPATSARSFPCYVQDCYGLSSKTHPGEWKYTLFRRAIDYVKNTSGPFVLFNYASGTTIGIVGVYIQPDVIKAFGGQADGIKPATRLGWSLFDYENREALSDTYGAITVRELIIASNFNYAGFEQAYRTGS